MRSFKSVKSKSRGAGIKRLLPWIFFLTLFCARTSCCLGSTQKLHDRLHFVWGPKFRPLQMARHITVQRRRTDYGLQQGMIHAQMRGQSATPLFACNKQTSFCTARAARFSYWFLPRFDRSLGGLSRRFVVVVVVVVWNQAKALTLQGKHSGCR